MSHIINSCGIIRIFTLVMIESAAKRQGKIFAICYFIG